MTLGMVGLECKCGEFDDHKSQIIGLFKEFVDYCY